MYQKNIHYKNYPVIDTHCDMLYYLLDQENSNPYKKKEIGCAIPYLRDGNVKLQVMAAYSLVEKGSANKMFRQAELLHELIKNNGEFLTLISSPEDLNKVLNSKKTGILFSIENASGLCEEDEILEKTFDGLNNLRRKFRILYISFTHHGENRFGGGNNTKTGLKNDGKVLLDYLNGKKIAVDLSHSSDSLAFEILNYIDKCGLDIPIIASHSNFRSVYEHARNLPDELAKEIIRRKGLIGMNFLRAYIHPSKPEKLIDHILHGFKIGGGKAICFGADFFCVKNHPDKNRIPFFFKEHSNAGKYQEILKSLTGILSEDGITALSHKNVLDFIKQILI